MGTTNHSLWDVLMQLTAGDLAMVITLGVFFCMIMIVVIVAAVARTIHQMHKHRLDDAFKRDLVEQGFTADEITKIVEASAGEKKPVHQ